MMKKQYGDSSHFVMCNEFLLGEILSRLPVKSLMRFNCVCKFWRSLIHKDRSFTDLHFARSKTSCSITVGGGGIQLIMWWPSFYVFSSAELLLSQGVAEAVQRQVYISGVASIPSILGAINGLIALSDRESRSVRIFNPITGQSTPWIQSMIKQQHERSYEKIQVIDEDGHYITHWILYVNDNWYYFGYDPVTMEHKVVLFWIKNIYANGDFLPSENICEVMTIDSRQHNNNNLSWRRIDGELSLPPTISPSEFASSLYANGCIYWLRTGGQQHSVTEPLIVEFNVGSERFRVISFPSYIIEDIRYPYISQLIQIDGHLAVLAKKVHGEGPDTIVNNSPSMKMCVLRDKKLKDSSVTTTSNSGHFYWTEETFMMPPFKWDMLKSDSIQAVPGTDLLIISSEGEDGGTFYFYDWRKKTFSKDEQFFVTLGELPPYHSGYLFEYFVYKESLLPVI